MQPCKIAESNATVINELNDAFTSFSLCETGDHGTKRIFLHGNTPPDVVPGNSSDATS